MIICDLKRKYNEYFFKYYCKKSNNITTYIKTFYKIYS